MIDSVLESPWGFVEAEGLMRSESIRKSIIVATLASLVLAAAIASNFLLDLQKPPFPTPTPTSPTPTPASPTPTPNPSPTPSNPIRTQTPNPTASFTRVPALPITVIGAEVYGGDLVDGAVNWGSLQIGESKNASFYLQSTSNVPISFAFSTADWNPSGIHSYISLSWDYDRNPLNPGQTIFLTLTLNTQLSLDFANYLGQNDVTMFDFNLIIYPCNYQQ